MKIIQRGTPPREREWKFRCAICGTVFECMQHEGTVVSDPRDGDALKIACPVCERECYGSQK